jgi:acyl carrier protein
MEQVTTEVVRQLKQTVPSLGSFELGADLKDELGLSSLSLISVLTQLCQKLDVDMLLLTDADLARLDKVSDLIDLFCRHAPARSA